MVALSHFLVLASHPGRFNIYSRVKQHFYWSTLVENLYATVRNCAECVQNRLKLRKNVSLLKSGCMDIFGELVRTAHGFRYLLIITDRFTKLVRTTRLREDTTSNVSKQCVKH